MSELQNYYNYFCTGYWADRDASKCGCKGSGWALSDVDTWHKCPYHEGRHPESEYEEPTAAEYYGYMPGCADDQPVSDAMVRDHEIRMEQRKLRAEEEREKYRPEDYPCPVCEGNDPYACMLCNPPEPPLPGIITYREEKKEKPSMDDDTIPF